MLIERKREEEEEEKGRGGERKKKKARKQEKNIHKVNALFGICFTTKLKDLHNDEMR